MSNQINLSEPQAEMNLPAPDADQFNITIPFPICGPVPFELIDQELDNAGIDCVYAHYLYIRLFGLLDWKKTIRIGFHDFMAGWTGCLSDNTLKKLLRCSSRSTVRKAMKMLLDAGLVKRYKRPGDKYPYYKIMLFDKVIEWLKDNSLQIAQIEYLAE